MTRVIFVVDTNVMISGLITSDRSRPVARILDDMLAGMLPYLLSPALLDEYRAVLARPKLVKLHGLAESERDALLIDLVGNAIWRDPVGSIPTPDPGDDHLWALLSSQTGGMLITGDQLLIDRPPAPASVISPRTYLEQFAPT